MEFLKEIVLIFISKLADIFSPLKPKDKELENGVVISRNQRTSIKNTKIIGGVVIEKNKDLNIESGDFNGEREMDRFI